MVARYGLFEPEMAHWYTDADRRDQLHRLATACAELADLVDVCSPSDAREYRALGETANRLRDDGYDQEQLNDLAAHMPSGPWWLNPKSPDYDRGRGQWEERVAAQHHEADRALVELRAVAAYDPP